MFVPSDVYLCVSIECVRVELVVLFVLYPLFLSLTLVCTCMDLFNVQGGAIYNAGTITTIDQCHFNGNEAVSITGRLYHYVISDKTVVFISILA